MKIKGRRQSPNVDDVREPRARARREVQFETDREWPIRGIDAQQEREAAALDVQATFAPYKSMSPEEIMKKDLRKMAMPNEYGHVPIHMNRMNARWAAKSVQDTFRTPWWERGMDAIGMEMLLGPRWKD